ncbi:MAG: ribonuclease R [Pseudomonadota bacterium]
MAKKPESRHAKQRGPSDPHAEREARRYEHPIASRTAILDLLRGADAPLPMEGISSAFALTSDRDLEALRRRLRAMQRDGQVHVDRRGGFGAADALHLLRCRVQGHRDGYGFAIPDGESDDVFLTARQMRSLFDGDTVLVAITGSDRRGRPEGKVVEILERGVSQVVGRYQEESGIGFVLPDNARLTQEILIPPREKNGATSGQIVTALITHYPDQRLGAKGRITEVLGEHLDPGLEIDIAIRSHNIPWEWPEAVQREAGSLRDEPSDSDKDHRVDLRDKPFVTIDGEDARDFDDAVFCERRRSGGWRLWVAIADVSHYVQSGSALDDEAQARGNSVYFPERVVPMFPEVLSNGLCSLRPRVDRLALAVEMELSDTGELGAFRFCEAVIHSHARLTYTQVGTLIEDGTCDDIPRELGGPLKSLHSLYSVLKEARQQRGAIDFETVETRIVFNEARKIESIEPVRRNDAHRLIEECMLCANVAAARFFDTHNLPVLYRVHTGPSGEKLENLRAFLSELALGLGGGEAPTPTDYQRLMSDIAERDDRSVIQTMLLRSLSQAVYTPENNGHFGLNYPAYAHFTSPIRRYPDLLVHRAIRSIVRSKARSKLVKRLRGTPRQPIESGYGYGIPQVAAFGEHCSMTERRADDATRDVQAWLKCEYLRDRVGETFDGVVSAVTNFGLFVELSDLYIEGLVHITSLPGDYYRFDHAQQRLVGERTGRSYRLGARLQVLVAAVNLDEKKIDLEPAGETQTRARKTGHKAGYKTAKESGKETGKTTGKKSRKKSGAKAAEGKRNQKKRKGKGSTAGSSSTSKGSESQKVDRTAKSTRRKANKRKNDRSASTARTTGGARSTSGRQ